MKRKLREIKSFFRGITRGTLNIIKWMPVIWRDRDFDQEYLYIIMYEKLSNMEKFFRSEYAYTMCAVDTADEIKEAKDLLGAMINNEYIGKVEISTDEFINTDGGRFNVDHKNTNYHKWIDEMSNAEKSEDESMKNAFKIIADKSAGWWD